MSTSLGNHINKYTVLFTVVCAVAFLALFYTASVNAAPVDVLKACDYESQVCKGTNGDTVNTIIGNVINLLIMVVGIISVIMIVIGGIRYTTSSGNASETKTARDTIIYSIVGLVISIMAFAIVNFVLNGLK